MTIWWRVRIIVFLRKVVTILDIHGERQLFMSITCASPYPHFSVLKLTHSLLPNALIA